MLACDKVVDFLKLAPLPAALMSQVVLERSGCGTCAALNWWGAYLLQKQQLPRVVWVLVPVWGCSWMTGS